MIPQAFIHELLARVDIVDVVGRYVRLRKSGANYIGLCPFHAEKSPSFTVSAAKQFYHCFGCGAHGSAIGFLMEHAGLGYIDAVGELARSLGLEVPHEAGRAGPAHDPRTPGLLELLARASQYYRRRLRDAPRAIDYLKRRGLTGETARRFALGYAPDQWRGLEAAVPDYDAPELVEAGLVVDNRGDDGRQRRYDRFRDRIMFPIRNPRGQTIGFGGRVLDRGEPKYLNSPETPLFSKGRELYGLFEAREAVRRLDCAVVVEGYMDVVMLAQHGVDNAVATLGTATTPDHVRKLLRLAGRVVYAFDGDDAGRRAAWRALEASLPQASDSARIDFLFLPASHDPDSFVRERGAGGFRESLADALPLSEFLLGELAARTGLHTPEARARMLAEARPLLQDLGAPALRLQLVHRLAELTRLSPGEVEAYLAQAPRGPDAGRTARAAAGAAAAAAGPSAAVPAEPGARRRQAGRSRAGRPRPDPSVPRPSVEGPDLEGRVRLLVALHPPLAARIERGEWLSPGLLRWIGSVAALPPGSTLANVKEALRGQEASGSAAIERLERELASDAAALADLPAAAAAAELQAAVEQLRDRHLRRRIDALVSAGIHSDEDRALYRSLLAMRKRA